MYRTGDIGIFTDSQNMQYIAREDNQIQLNGYRIELAEIELCIREYTGINEVLVMKSEENTAELTKLIVIKKLVCSRIIINSQRVVVSNQYIKYFFQSFHICN